VAEPVRVLVVDDDDVIRQLITVNLELEGYEVTGAADGQEALERAQQWRPDVMTLDMMMPRLDGLATAAALRADPATAHIRVCLVSARAQAADRERAATAPGIDAFLSKPFDPEDLVRVVGELAESR
jgi:CheY-like chemotaxis protein